MAKWAVVYLIHVRTPHQHIPKLVVEDVPDELTADEVKDWLEEMGYTFGACGVPWANHYVARLRDCPPSVRGAYRAGEVEIIKYRKPEPVD